MAWAIALLLLLTQLESTEPLYRSQAVDVHIDVRVMENGKAVLGLGPSDFVVSGQGREFRVTSVAAEEQPLDVLLVLDMSRSLLEWRELLAEYAGRAFSLLRPADRVSVATFSDNFRVRVGFSPDRQPSSASRDRRRTGAQRACHLPRQRDPAFRAVHCAPRAPPTSIRTGC